MINLFLALEEGLKPVSDAFKRPNVPMAVKNPNVKNVAAYQFAPMAVKNFNVKNAEEVKFVPMVVVNPLVKNAAGVKFARMTVANLTAKNAAGVKFASMAVKNLDAENVMKLKSAPINFYVAIVRNVLQCWHIGIPNVRERSTVLLPLLKSIISVGSHLNRVQKFSANPNFLRLLIF